MKLYRWYSETFNMSGVTAADYIATESDVVMEVEAYIDNTFDEAKLVDDLLISVWSIENDDDFNEMFPTTIAVSY